MNLKQLSLTVALSSLIAGCAMPPPMPQPPVVSSGTESRPARQQESQIDLLISAADKAQPIRAAELKLQAAQLFINEGKNSQAMALLEEVDTTHLPPSLQFNIIKIKTEGALSNQDSQQALSYLAYMPSLETLPEADRYASDQLYAEAYSLSGESLEEAKILIESSAYIHEPSQVQDLHNRIWRALQNVNNQELYSAIHEVNTPYVLQGWLELAQSTRTIADVTSQTSNLDNWVALWQTHPAAAMMPEMLTSRSDGSLISAGRIGVLLPSSGKLAKAGNAIRDGLVTAQLAAQQLNGTAPSLVFLDSNQFTDGNAIAQAASERGFDLMIGPLDKNKVTQLAQLPSLPIPVLALNYVDYQTPNLYQYGLSPEDEARDAAQQALNNGHRYALIMTPNTSWGLKAADAFEKTFTEFGGSIVARTAFSKNSLNQDISNLLNTDTSKARAKNLKKITGLNFEFEERRRQDADVILLAARPGNARLIKPILSFYFAGDLPVYATSQVYSGQPNAARDLDLDGIAFGDSPWVLSPPSENRRAIEATRSDAGTRFGRLYAMGIDAYNLHPYLQQLGANTGSRLSGETGQLSVDQNNRVLRHQQWAIFKNGVPVLTE